MEEIPEKLRIVAEMPTGQPKKLVAALVEYRGQPTIDIRA